MDLRVLQLLFIVNFACSVAVPYPNPLPTICNADYTKEFHDMMVKINEKLDDLIYALNPPRQRNGRLATPFRNCQDIKNAGYSVDGFYYIDPSGKCCHATDKPILVHCNLNQILDKGITEIFHDSMSDTMVTGIENEGGYVRKITYDLDMEDIRLIMSTATKCQQYFRYNCRGSVFHNKDNVSFAWWLSWDGRRQTYWQEGTTIPQTCWCGVKGTCTNNKRCECDVNDSNVVTMDDGLFNNMDDLPITALHFGDTGSANEYGVHYLDKLQCFH